MKHCCSASLATFALFLGATGSFAQTITLRVTAAPSIFKAMYEEVFHAFERANPDIKISLRAWTRDADELAQETLLGATVGDLPDLSMQAANRLRLLADRKLAVPLDQFIAIDGEWNSLGVGPAARKAGAVYGQTFGLGFNLSLPIVYYNLDLVTRAGCDPKHLPATWPEIIALAKKIRVTSLKHLGGFFQYANGWAFPTLVESQGGRVMTPDDSVLTVNTPEALQSLEILRAFGEAGQAELDLTHDQARQAFAAGMIGIMIDSSSGLTGLERQAAGNFQIAIGPFPLKAGAGHLQAAGGLAVMFARDPVRRQAAWTCMKFLCGPIAQTMMAQHTAYLPVNTITISSPDLLGRVYQQQPSKQILLSQLPHLSASYAFPGLHSAKIDALINDLLQQVVVLSETPQAALARMQEEIGPLLPRRGTN